MKRPIMLMPSLALLIIGCATSPRSSLVFSSPAGSRKSDLRIGLGPEKDGLSTVSMTGTLLHSAVVSGEAKREGEAWRISLTKLDYFNSWTNGWTQASFLLDGSAALRKGSSGWLLEIERAPQLDIAGSASIRYYDTYLRGDKGLQEFSRRWDRIRAVATDLSKSPDVAARILDERSLRRYLFPEIYGYDSPPASKRAKAFAQGFGWDTDYTKEHFAEPLRILRDSGTLLRDYKESSELWALALGWKGLWERAERPVAEEYTHS